MSGPNYSKRTILKETVISPSLGKERPLRIYLPPGYNELVSHRVIYCQDGEECFNFGRIATFATQLILEEDVEPFIIVGVDVDMPNRTAEYAPDGNRFGAYSQFFLQELLPFIEARYPVRQEAESRVLIGDSLGGTVSLHLSLLAPEFIHKVISLSGAFLDSSLQAVAEITDLSHLQMFQLIGTDETAVKTDRGTFDFLEANRRMHQLLNQKGADVQYVEKPGKHLWGFWQNEMLDALRWAMGD